MPPKKLNSDTVNRIFGECLLTSDEARDNTFVNGNTINEEKVTLIQGVLSRFGLNKARLDANAADIAELLNELPSEFKDGWTFLNMCTDKDGNNWTDLHQTMEQLVVLGIGVNKISYPFPKEMWKALPGGMPYIKVNI